MEIVTWVLDGALEHRDSEGNDGVITPRRRAAHERGHRHPPLGDEREQRPSPSTSCRCGCRPTPSASRPATSSATSAATSTTDELFPLASGAEHVDAAIHINQRRRDAVGRAADAGRTRHRARRAVRARVRLHRARRRSTDAGALAAGDAVRLTDAGALELTATDDGTEVIIWEMWAELDGR